MSQENVDIAKRAVDAYNRRDVDTLDDITSPDFQLFPAMDAAVEGEVRVLKGREGLETYLGEVGATWEGFRLIVEEYRDLGGPVLVLGYAQGTGRGSGVPVDAAIGQVFDFRDGKLSQVRSFLDRDEALKAVGLEE
jgi:ketosteroid isomerase-like protein